MTALTVRQCLEPPNGTGDLNARALWPDAFTETGGGIADVEGAIAVYLTEGYARVTAAGQTDETLGNESARQWARHRAFRQAHERAIAVASSVSTDEGWASEITMEQINALAEKAEEALTASDAALGAVADAPSESYGVIRSLR